MATSAAWEWRDALDRWLQPFLSGLSHPARRAMCPLYVAGLIGLGDRRSVQPMAARADGPTQRTGTQGNQHLPGEAVWLVREERVLPKDSLRDFGQGAASDLVMVVVIEPQAEIYHLRTLEDDLGPAPKAGQEMSDVAVVTLDGNGEILAGEQLLRVNQPMIPGPIVGDEGDPRRSCLGERLAAGRIVTAAQNPGHSSPADRIMGAPEPERA